MTVTLLYLILGITVLLGIIINIKVKRKFINNTIKKNILMKWGKVPVEEYKTGELKAISSYYKNFSENKKGKHHFIDDTTWNDLDMDSVFKRINNTLTTAGEEYLYFLLRKPEFDDALLIERNRLIEYFIKNQIDREKIQMTMAGLGKNRFIGISDYFFNNEKGKTFNGTLYKLLSLSFLISPFLMIYNLIFGLLIMVILFITNITFYYRVKNRIEAYLEGLSYIVDVIRISRKIGRTGTSSIEKYAGKLNELSSKIKGISISSFYQLFYKTNDMFLENIKVVFLVELIGFESLLKCINRFSEEIRDLFETIGFLDSIISIASYRESLNFYSVPELHKSVNDKSANLFFSDAYHPLINEPVANSINMEKSTLITGSNASGKSTFLKTVAINAILAQTIYTCLARDYKSCYFMIFTSMALRDDLSKNESYYVTEIKSLKRILDNLNWEFPLLCIIDEVLRGTNTIERIAASSEILYNLGKSNCICVAATHDIELTSILKNHYDNYHFREHFEDGIIFFDYIIFPGKSKTHNAIRLLRHLGYGENIVRAAEVKAEGFLQEGKWK
jgi:hypothetical protein